jgi:hypothetical protein
VAVEPAGDPDDYENLGNFSLAGGRAGRPLTVVSVT